MSYEPLDFVWVDHLHFDRAHLEKAKIKSERVGSVGDDKGKTLVEYDVPVTGKRRRMIVISEASQEGRYYLMYVTSKSYKGCQSLGKIFSETESFIDKNIPVCYPNNLIIKKEKFNPFVRLGLAKVIDPVFKQKR